MANQVGYSNIPCLMKFGKRTSGFGIDCWMSRAILFKPLETSQQIASHSYAYDTKSGLIIFDLADYSWSPLFHVFPSELPNIGTDQTLATLPCSVGIIWFCCRQWSSCIIWQWIHCHLPWYFSCWSRMHNPCRAFGTFKLYLLWFALIVPNSLLQWIFSIYSSIDIEIIPYDATSVELHAHHI